MKSYPLLTSDERFGTLKTKPRIMWLVFEFKSYTLLGQFI